jgi:hypothetical protein
MKRTTRTRKLDVRAEVLRSLSAAELSAAAGGVTVMATIDPDACVPSRVCTGGIHCHPE